MGIDCIFYAENRNEIKIDDIQKDSLAGKFPGGIGVFNVHHLILDWHDLEKPRFAYCYLEFFNDLVIVHDGCRLKFNQGYQLEMINYLKEKCGGEAGVCGDWFKDFGFKTASEISQRFEWQEPRAENEISDQGIVAINR